MAKAWTERAYVGQGLAYQRRIGYSKYQQYELRLDAPDLEDDVRCCSGPAAVVQTAHRQEARLSSKQFAGNGNKAPRGPGANARR